MAFMAKLILLNKPYGVICQFSPSPPHQSNKRTFRRTYPAARHNNPGTIPFPACYPVYSWKNRKGPPSRGPFPLIPAISRRTQHLPAVGSGVKPLTTMKSYAYVSITKQRPPITAVESYAYRTRQNEPSLDSYACRKMAKN